MSFRSISQIFGVESESDSFPLQTKFIGLELKVDQGFYPSTFAYSRFPWKIQFFYSLLSLLSPWDIPMVDSEERTFGKKYGFYIVDKHDFLQWISAENNSILSCLPIYFLSALSAIGSFEEKSTRKIHATCLYPCL